mmetsp:Transcript_13988/g.35229  ORF Transcript_13988/g.35229 Transcript_13988/m.35229 type:complete len:305 (-) Transcript_13988:261-1175(-)
MEPETTEEQLEYLFKPLVPIKEVRLVLDKFTGAPRGFAFVHFHSIADATRALQQLQNVAVPGQAAALRLCYARDRMPPPGSNATSSAAADALAAGNFSSQYAAWEPKKYDETAPAEEAASGANSTGFQFDASTGYYYDAASGYYYDANTGLYCNAADQQWYMYNAVTGSYLPVGASQQQAAAPGDASAPQTQQPTAASTSASAAAPSKPAAAKKKGAVIGAAPQLSTQALLAKARAQKAALAKKKAAEEKAAAAAAAAAAAQMPPPPAPAARPIQGVVHESKRGGPSGVIYQGKWRGGPQPPAN